MADQTPPPEEPGYGMTSACPVPVKPRPGTLVQYQAKTYKVMAYVSEHTVAIRPPSGGLEQFVPVTHIIPADDYGAAYELAV